MFRSKLLRKSNRLGPALLQANGKSHVLRLCFVAKYWKSQFPQLSLIMRLWGLPRYDVFCKHDACMWGLNCSIRVLCLMQFFSMARCACMARYSGGKPFREQCLYDGLCNFERLHTSSGLDASLFDGAMFLKATLLGLIKGCVGRSHPPPPHLQTQGLY